MFVTMSHAVERKAEKVFPASLLLEGRACLVVGGGRVADRKVRQLLEAGARVTVVSPEIGAELADLVKGKDESGAALIRHLPREFRTGDTAGFFLVFAATDDLEANRRVREDCRGQGALCGCVDFGWREGDFISPAVLRSHGLTVAVSTGGRSCRRARMLKESLGSHLAAMGNVGLLLLGTSHGQLPLAQREKLSRELGGAAVIARLLRQVWGVHEFLLLETCNRIELLAVADQSGDCLELVRRVLGFDRLASADYYVKQGVEAFRHSAMLASGLLSQVLGEGHVAGQLKEALETARREGSAGAALEEWIATALRMSREIRRDLALGGPETREIEDDAADFIVASAPGCRRFLVVGTGVTGAGVLQRVLADHPAARVDWYWFHHCPELPPPVANRVCLRPVAELADGLAAAEVVICAAGGGEPVLRTSHAVALAGRNLLVLDLAMPRNVEPELAAAAPGLRLVNLDGLKAWSRSRPGQVSQNEKVLGNAKGRRSVTRMHSEAIPDLLEAAAAIVEKNREWYDQLLLHIQGWNEGK